MTFLHNDTDGFAGEAVDGLVAAHPERLLRVPGGVVRTTESPGGQVAVVLGGGSGHYPAFAGWVGPGFAHGASCGNTFASPPATHIASVARAADGGGGILLGFGNYAGDVLHFGQAAAVLRAEGRDVRALAVTDDVASADDRSARRGVAGDLVVFKILCAAAEDGLDLDAVEQVGRRANERTVTFGVAFTGCTLPGAEQPLFSLPRGTAGVGLGIHGEPGLGEAVIGSADEVADLLVGTLLADVGDRAGGRVAVLVNGLGSVTHEELFVLYRRVAARLGEEGLTPVRPEVGEHVTSLDMAGVSLTLCFLDDELERYWLAPADTPAFRRGALPAPAPARRRVVTSHDGRQDAVRAGSAESAAAARRLAGAAAVVGDLLAEHTERLGVIDAVAGDGDHGMGMARGSDAAARRARELKENGAGLAATVTEAGLAWSEAAGGTSGALWGAALAAAAGVLDDTSAPSGEAVVAAVGAAVDAVRRLGGASPGDKTMVDAALPFAEALAAGFAETGDLRAAANHALAAARAGVEATAAMPARRGRARTHGERSIGTPDAGAVSFALVAECLVQQLSRTSTLVGKEQR